MGNGTVCLFVAMLLSAGVACAEGVDHVLFDFRGKDTAEGWRLNIYGKDARGVKGGGSGKMELLSGKHAGDKAMRFSSQEAGSYNFISPEISEGAWRNRKYYGAEIRYRGDGSAGRMQVYAVTPDGQYAITLRFDGTTTWKTETHRSGWSRPGTPPLDWSRISRIYVHGSGTRFVDIEKIALVGGVKPIHLEEQHLPAGVGDASISPRSDTKIEVTQTELLKLAKVGSGYNCRLLLAHQNVEGSKVLAELTLTPPGETARVVAKQEIPLRSSLDTHAGLPFEYTQTRDGSHLLSLVIRDSQGRVAAVERFKFLLMRPRDLDYHEVVLWPEPQIWKPGSDRWVLPETLTLGTTAGADAFPAEHLAEKLRSRYGVRVSKPRGKPAHVRLDYVKDGVKPEGFVLDVDPSGVHLQASSPRGMYYAVRALLDIARQSSFARPEAGILKDVAQELLDLFEPTYFHMGGDEVTHGWNRITERTCEFCAGKPKSQLLLEHWSELARFFEERNVTPILFDDMLSVTWNGGAPYDCAEILPELPRNLIIATWSIPPLSVPPQRLRTLGFTPWSVQTAFPSQKMDAVPAIWKDYDAFGISETTTWVWSNFTHSRKQCNYSTPALHANAACCWKPAAATVGQAALIHSDGIHWSNVMRVPDWGTRKLFYQPISIAAACNDSTRDASAGDGKGWMDLGPEQDLSWLPNGRMSIGGIAFDRPKAEKDCILLEQEQASRPVKVGRKVLGFALAHTAGADEAQTKALERRFFRKNTDPLALPVACYKVRYEDGASYSIPLRLGYDVHFWNCDPRARVMPGPSTYWMGSTAAGQRKDPIALDACVWVMEWRNPLPDVPVEDVTFVAAGTEAAVACLGITTVGGVHDVKSR